LNNKTINNKKRNTFISVLGRLSFTGVAIQLAYGIILLLGGIVLSSEKEMSVNPNQIISIGMDNFNKLNDWLIIANKTAQYSTYIGIINILAATICFVGIVKMWRLKRKGFFIYTIGEIVAPIATLILTGFSGIWMNIILPLTFLFLWISNIKRMN
jgi:hypothetical protein